MQGLFSYFSKKKYRRFNFIHGGKLIALRLAPN